VPVIAGRDARATKNNRQPVDRHGDLNLFRWNTCSAAIDRAVSVRRGGTPPQHFLAEVEPTPWPSRFGEDVRKNLLNIYTRPSSIVNMCNFPRFFSLNGVRFSHGSDLVFGHLKFSKVPD
jgi:hypothetical protein